jgi:Fe(3+) dicitrate transport protein
MNRAQILARCILGLVILFGTPFSGNSQTGLLRGLITDEFGEAIVGATVYIESRQQAVSSDSTGNYLLPNLPFGSYEVLFFIIGKESHYQQIELEQAELQLEVVLSDISKMLNSVTVTYRRDKGFGRSSLASVENFGIYEGKKTEVIEMSEVVANVSTNNARQVYAKITGLNIWESDGAGLQLGIGGRGLSPNRTANFNVRQNGYDISADALGYPESYYTPPLEALDRIELVRGAASLQYGTQFGGMLNFRFKKGPSDKAIELSTRQTLGSWGFFNSFNSIGGTVAKGKLNYYAYAQFKRGDGFRPNAGFQAANGFGSLHYQLNKRLKLGLELTRMQYLAQQPGGLTDRNFEDNPRQSLRERNWFEVDWNMAALSWTYEFSERTQLNSRNFGLLAHRNALGNLERINVADFGANRTLISGQFQNIGHETRLLHRYQIGTQQQTLLLGIRLYRGRTSARQGEASNGAGPSFVYLNPYDLEDSDYQFSNNNLSAFLEHLFQLCERWSLTPGVRFEHIGTSARGYFKQRVFDGAGNLIVENRTDEAMGRARNFVIAGLGANFRLNSQLSFYANISQNYRAINFSDIRVVNPNLRVDPDMRDETGFTADLGLKVKKEQWYQLELTAFLLRYNDKIGQILRADQPPLFLDYRFRGNISDARNMGLEFFGELNLLPLLRKEASPLQWTIFLNAAYVDARYINTQDNSIRNKQVEMVPPIMLRTGTQLSYQSFRVALQFAHVARHFSDATNALRTSTAVEGLIPSYQVADLSVAYRYRRYLVEASINNLFNHMYFTRRAEGYPGPGIIPSDGRGFFLTLGASF